MLEEHIPDLSHLAEVFRRYPDVLAVYLFGSWTSGRWPSFCE